MDYNNIKQILEKYWEGETSLQEENLLHEYFNSDDVVEELKDVQPMFQYFKEEQTTRIENPNFENELIIFSKADINRAAWLDKYSVDSTFNTQQGLSAIDYIALDKKLQTKSIRVEFINNTVSSVEIITTGDSAISKTQNHLKYSPTKGYSIKSVQDVKFVSKNDIKIQVIF